MTSFTRFKAMCVQIKTVLCAHKLLCVCCVLGIGGGIGGFLAGCVAGSFAELILRRLREEKTASQQSATAHGTFSPQTDTERAAAFATLELSPDATPKEIKSAHRRLAAQYHPDSPSGNPERFLQIQQAYELLSARK